MRITLEADYAVRIIDCIARAGRRMDAKTVSEKTGVTLRFTLKILRELGIAGLVRSFKGVQGGYELARVPGEISLKDVIEAVDGPILINRCLDEGHTCSRSERDRLCDYYDAFAEVSMLVRDRLSKVTFEKAVAE